MYRMLQQNCHLSFCGSKDIKVGSGMAKSSAALQATKQEVEESKQQCSSVSSRKLVKLAKNMQGFPVDRRLLA